MSKLYQRLNIIDYTAYSLSMLFALDRLLKLATIIHFFRRRPPASPQQWPTVTLIQPLTRGASGLPANLRSRTQLDYPGTIQHLLVCDTQDIATQNICHNYLNDFPELHAKIILVDSTRPIATKTEKMNAALLHVSGDILCFIDDDIALRPHTLRILVPHLLQPGVGAVFGLACYTNWQTIWSILMSLFVNTNALLSYIPITYLTEPFTITGHCFALKGSTFQSVGGFTDMNERIDDDHELARRIRHIGLHCVQTPLIYDVNNELNSLRAYNGQMKRWFVIPRQTMLPFLTGKERLITLLGSLGNLLPTLLALLALLARRRSVLRSLGICMTLFAAIQIFCEKCYLQRSTPLKRWLLLPIVAIMTPLQILWAILSNDEIEWRNQRLLVQRDGKMVKRAK